MNQTTGNGRSQDPDRAYASTAPEGRDPDEIQEDIARTRAELDSTLSALERRLSPDYVIDRATEYLRGDGGREMLDTMTAVARRNPVPTALLGVSLAWLMLSGREGRLAPHRAPVSHSQGGGMRERGQRLTQAMQSGRSRLSGSRDQVREQATRLSETARDRAARMSGTARSQATRLSGTARQQVSRLGSGASGLGQTLSDTLSDLGHSLSETLASARHTMAEGSHSARESMAHAGETARERAARLRHSARERGGQSRGGLERMMREQPWVLGAVGLMIGAAIGASAPPTRREDRLMGPAKDSLEERARSQANLQLRKGKRVAEAAAEAAGQAAADAANEEARRQGLKSDKQPQQRSGES